MSAFGCSDVERFLDAYIDGEFAAEDRGGLEEHITSCPSCAERVRLHAGLKAALKAACPRAPLPENLRQRITSALREEDAHKHSILGRRLAWSTVPLGAVAMVLGMIFFAHHSLSPVATEAIARHQRDLPIEVSGGDQKIRDWFTHKVDFAVHPPRLPVGAALRGGRLANIRDRQAAYLLYDVDGRKVSVFVFDPGDLQMAGRSQRQIGNRQIFFDSARGYNVALFRDHDVGYAFTSDMDEDRMLQLVSAAVVP